MIHKCAFCKEDAVYDAKTKNGPWAFLCEKHFTSFECRLGVGYGQKIKKGEK